MEKFWLQLDSWAGAAASQRHYWEKVDRNLVDLMQSDPMSALWKVAGINRVARNFPYGGRATFAAKFASSARAISSSAPLERYDSFVRVARELARFAKEHPGEARGYRALSGVSKMLWHLEPSVGFIYDANALRAVKRAGLLAAFQDDLGRWGGIPVNGEVDFLLFAAAYRQYFLSAP